MALKGPFKLKLFYSSIRNNKARVKKRLVLMAKDKTDNNQTEND